MWLQGLRFAMVGVVNTGIGLTVILLLQFVAHLHPYQANAGGYLIGGGVSYLLNSVYTFRNDRPHRAALPRFAMAALACFGLNLLALRLGTEVLQLPAGLAQVLAVVTYVVSFFLVSRYWVFSQPRRA